jgi:TatA/E family protein of Tat protein translocase
MGIESPVHLLFIGIVALVVLGPKRLPELARRLGDGVREFREAIDAGADQREAQHQQAHAQPPAGADATAPPQPAQPADVANATATQAATVTTATPPPAADVTTTAPPVTTVSPPPEQAAGPAEPPPQA